MRSTRSLIACAATASPASAPIRAGSGSSIRSAAASTRMASAVSMTFGSGASTREERPRSVTSARNALTCQRSARMPSYYTFDQRGGNRTVELLVVIVVVLLLALVVGAAYNRLVTLRQRVNEAYSDIDVQLKRRHDLIPNLVETVKGYAAHERGVFDEVTQARANAVAAGSGSPQQRAQAENVLTGALRSLFAVAEAYPQLQAVQEFKDLSENLRDTEDKIQFSRRFYNGQVRDYNTAPQTFPTVALAGTLGFKPSEYFEVEEPSDREVPKVSFTPTT